MMGSFAERFKQFVDACPKEACEICGKEFPGIQIMHVSKSDQRLTCCGCAMRESERIFNLLFSEVKPRKKK